MTLNVNGSYPDWVNLGIIRVWGSQTAETLLKLVETRLRGFGLSIDRDIIAMVTDGASCASKGMLLSVNT